MCACSQAIGYFPHGFTFFEEASDGGAFVKGICFIEWSLFSGHG